MDALNWRESDRPEFISLPELARRLGVSRDSVYRATRRGDIPAVFTVGRLRRVNWTAFLRETAG